MSPSRHRFWGGATALLHRSRRVGWSDLLIVAGLAGLLFGVIDLGAEWTAPFRPNIAIDLSVWALPRYTFYSLMRGLIAYAVSLGFTLAYGYWAAHDHAAERILIPLLDVLQSIPVLGFMPGLIIALVALFPRSNVGLELAAIIMIFTGQAWNMTFSFYHSLRSIPLDLREAATLYRFGWWQRFTSVELPFATTGLVWNSIMSMAGGWFFLMINEAFRLGDRDFRLPGIGSYMSVAVDHGRWGPMVLAIVAMTSMIVVLDQLLWRPVVVWAQKFRVEEGGQTEAMSSWFLDWLRASRVSAAVASLARRLAPARALSVPRPSPREAVGAAPRSSRLAQAPLAILLVLLLVGVVELAQLLRHVGLHQWQTLAGSAGVTLLRVLVSTGVGTLWALPAGLAIGLTPRLSRVLQPVIQVVASFPAPMLFPLVIALLHWSGISLGFGSIVLMLLGTQWYILFNVIAGAVAVPSDLSEAARSYGIVGWRRFKVLLLPSVFPYLVTGWVTAAGGAWNASIVAEYVTYRGQTLQTVGLGAQISAAAARADFPLLAAAIVVMSMVVVTFNRSVWRRCYHLAETRFSLNR